MSFVDKFTRDNSADIGNGWVEESDTFSISNNQLVCAGGPYPDLAAAPVSSDILDGTVQIDFNISGAVMPQLWARYNSATGIGVLIWWFDGNFRISEQTGAGSGSHSTRINDGGVGNIVAGVNYRMHLTLIGTRAIGVLTNLDTDTVISTIDTNNDTALNTALVSNPCGVSNFGGGTVTYDDLIVAPSGIPTPTLLGVNDLVTDGNSFVLTGLNFGASQGSGSVIISPTDDINDAAAETQTVTSWGDTSVTFTSNLPAGDPSSVYIFVTDTDADVNNAGYFVSVQVVTGETINLTEPFHNGSAPLANRTGITAYIYLASDGTLADTITNLTTNGAGVLSQILSENIVDASTYRLVVVFPAGEEALVRGIVV